MNLYKIKIETDEGDFIYVEVTDKQVRDNLFTFMAAIMDQCDSNLEEIQMVDEEEG